MNLIHSNSPCQRVRPLLDSYVSNELLVETTHEVLRHVGDCAQCQSALTELEQARQTLRRAVRNIQPPPNLRAKVQDSLHRPRPSVLTLQPAPATRWMAIAAAFTAVVFGGWMVRSLVVHTHDISGMLNVGWQDHLKCSLAGHLPSEPPEHGVLMAKMTSYAPLLPEVERNLPGYRVRQAHQCTVEGRKYVHIAMQKEGILLSVILVRKKSGEFLPGGLHSELRQGVEVAAFDAGGYLAFVIANEPRQEVRRIATALTPEIHKVLQSL